LVGWSFILRYFDLCMFISVRVVCATHILPRASRVSYVSFLLEVTTVW